MFPLTLFLAKLIGLFLLIVSASMATRKDVMVRTAHDMVRDRGLVLLIASMRLLAGLALVLSHTIWAGGALPIVITLIGWLTLARALILFFLPPEKLIDLFGALRFEQNYYMYVAITFVIGLYLTVAGFAG